MKTRTALGAVMAIVAAVSVTGCGHVMMMMHGTNVARPAATEFGTGPRASASRRFTATLQSDQPRRPRRLQTVRVAITDAAGVPVDGATIQVDGGMPQHGHGLPTRPRVTRALGNGLYEIEGVRFNMGGWWEFKLAIETAAGSDVVTFNLALQDAAMTTNRLLGPFGLMLATTMATVAAPVGDEWTEEDAALLSSMSLRELGPPPADPTNRVADDPRAVELGRRLFFDTRLSATGDVSCATCHIPEKGFQDGLPLARGVGVTNRRTMPIAGMAHSPFLFWDGRKDSLWAQALGPLESAVEHGGTREQYAEVIAAHYRADYEAIFGAMPALSTRDEATAVFVNIGKAIAAYERTIEYAPSRFDRYVDALQDTGRAPQGILSADEVAGLRLFIGRASCVNCHNGPLLTNNEFHNTGVPARPGLPADRGRFAGAEAVLRDEFNCRSRWSDSRSRCAELEFMIAGDHVLERAFKVPSLRNVAERAPYMHAGQFSTLGEVIVHTRAPKAPAGRSELEPLRLSARERQQIEAFLRSLSGDAQE